MNKALPLLKKKRLDERVTIPVEKQMRDDLMRLKLVHGVDHLEWVRQILEVEIDKLKKNIEVA